MSAKRKLWDVIEALGCHTEPYFGGVRVFIGRADVAQPALYRELWHLADAYVVGTLSGPSLHLMAKATPTLADFEALTIPERLEALDSGALSADTSAAYTLALAARLRAARGAA